MIRQLIINTNNLQGPLVIIDNVKVFSRYLTLNARKREISTGFNGDMRSDFPRQEEGYTSSVKVIRPDNGLFFKLPSYFAGIY